MRPYELINAQIASSPPGANGLVFLPYLLGECTPRWNPEAKGALIGLTLVHTRADVLRTNYPEEAISIGAAIIAGVGCGAFKDFDVVSRFISIMDRARPDPATEPVRGAQNFTCVRLFAVVGFLRSIAFPIDLPSWKEDNRMPHFDTGNTGFMLIAASLVMLMTPGLAFFYGGLVGRKNVLTIMIQSFLSLAVVDVIWFAVGYSLCFSGGQGAVIGDLKLAFLNGVNLTSVFGDGQIPMFAFIIYQMMFAIITPALITGAFANRVRFPAYFIFLVVWLILVYFPLVHMIWGGGLLAQWGVRDFAGGIVVHASAGFAALASVFFVGPRHVKDRGPHSIPLVALGTGLLWFGWYGFNAGSELRVDQVTVAAFLNTDLAASFAAVTWLALAWIFEKKPKFLGLLTGSIAGLACITPAAGFVTPWASIIIGILSGLVCYLAINLKKRLGWDDALDVWGVHGVGGVLGILCLGVFGSVAVNPAGFDGALRGGWAFLGRQAASGVGAAAYSFLIAFAALWVINKITRVRVAEGEEEVGLDTAELGEHAYL